MQYQQRRFFLSRLLAVVATLATSLAHGPAMAAAVTLEQLDADKDGYLTVGEAEYGGITMEEFKAADKNGDGRLSADEFKSIPGMGADVKAN